MSDSAQTKTCPLCAETIKAAAKVCPFCRTRQGRFPFWRQDLVLWVSALVLVWGSSFGLYLLLPEGMNNSGRSFARHRGDLLVERAALEHAKENPEYWLTGYVTNKGDYPWRIHELEVRLFRHVSGSLLDVRHPGFSERFVIQPHREQAFRVELGQLVFTNILEVRVQMAIDGDGPEKPD